MVTLGLAGRCFLGSLKQLHARAFTYQGCPHYANNFTYYAFWHCHNLPPIMLNNNPFHVIYVISDLCHTSEEFRKLMVHHRLDPLLLFQHLVVLQKHYMIWRVFSNMNYVVTHQPFSKTIFCLETHKSQCYLMQYGPL